MLMPQECDHSWHEVTTFQPNVPEHERGRTWRCVRCQEERTEPRASEPAPPTFKPNA